MNISIDISPLVSEHSVRGVGFYLKRLKDALEIRTDKNHYVFFTDHRSIPLNTNVIHFPYFDPYFITLPFVKKYKTIITIHDLIPRIFPAEFPAGVRGNLKWQVQKRLAKKADAIITDSEASKKDIINILHIPSHKIHVIYLAAAEEFQKIKNKEVLSKIKTKYKLPEKFLLYVGDVTWNKNLIRLISAIKKTDVPLVMVGKSLASTNFDVTNPWNNDLIAVQKMTKNNPQFMVLGFVPTEELVCLYNIADAFIMPSLYEGFGLPILEAMQSGTPVITSSEGSLPEIAGDAAYMIDAYSEESIINGINTVLSDKQLRMAMSEKGLIQAGKFNWNTTAMQTIKVYENVNH